LEKALGLLLLVFYITAVVGLAAAITYAVIRIFPTQRAPSRPDDGDPPSVSRGQEAMGKLFRRAKREAT
jgi:hypothetical protein